MVYSRRRGGRRKYYKRKFKRYYKKKYGIRRKRRNSTKYRFKKYGMKNRDYTTVIRRTQDFQANEMFTVGGQYTNIYHGTMSHANCFFPTMNYDGLRMTHYAKMYDEYRIRWVEVAFKFKYDTSSSMSYWTNAVPPVQHAGVPGELACTEPILYWKVDHNDLADPTMNDFAAKGFHGRQMKSGRFYKCRLSPKVQMPLYNGVVTSGYTTPDKPVWINTANINCPHYGLKWLIECVASRTPTDDDPTLSLSKFRIGTLQIQTTMCVDFRKQTKEGYMALEDDDVPFQPGTPEVGDGKVPDTTEGATLYPPTAVYPAPAGPS